MRSLIKSLLTVIVLFICYSGNAQTNEVIDNKKLVELTQAKLGDDLIIGFIKSSTTNFSCGLSDILILKKEGVSERVLAEVMRVCNTIKNTNKDENNSNNPLYTHSSGIYIYQKEDTGYVLKKLYATVVTQEKAGGFGNAFKKAVSYGFAKTASKASVNGPTANVKCKPDAVFYFYFDPKQEDKSSLNWWFSNASSPNEFTILKLTQNPKNREFKKEKSDSYTYQTGIDEDQKVQFTFEEPKSGIFKVIPKDGLKIGEYCFLYSSAVPNQYSNDKIFDFSVPK